MLEQGIQVAWIPCAMVKSADLILPNCISWGIRSAVMPWYWQQSGFADPLPSLFMARRVHVHLHDVYVYQTHTHTSLSVHLAPRVSYQ